MTSKELARLLGVSPATVSMALNGKPGINPETRQMILDAARENRVSTRSLSASSLRSICLVLFHRKATLLSSASFYNEVISGVRQTCEASGYGFSSQSVIGIQDLNNYLQALPRSETAGAILMGHDMTREDLSLLSKFSFPIVLLDNSAFSYPIDCVKIDNTSSAFTAVNFLIERVKSQPGYLRSSFSINNFDERSRGFEQAIVYNRMSRSSSPVHDLLPSIEGAYDDMTALLKAGLKPAACYFADNDLIAIGAVQALQRFGLRIPEDVAVIGFDDIEMSAHTSPPLTTMHVPKYHFGAAAVKRLLRLIRDPSLFPITIEMTANLVVREST